MRGNVVDMAVGVIIGNAFGKIVTSLVSDIIMPAIGLVTGGVNFTDYKCEIQGATITWGVFVQSVVDFLIVAFCIFMAIKLISKLHKKEEPAPEPQAPAGPTQEELLAEIRDQLKELNKK